MDNKITVYYIGRSHVWFYFSNKQFNKIHEEVLDNLLYFIIDEHSNEIHCGEDYSDEVMFK